MGECSMTLEDRILKTFDKVLENDKTHQWSLPSEKIDYFEKKIMSENLTIIFEKVAITETLKEVEAASKAQDEKIAELKDDLGDELRCFIDGDSLCVTKIDFKNIQESDVVFIKPKKELMGKIWKLTNKHPSIKCECPDYKEATNIQASGGAPL